VRLGLGEFLLDQGGGFAPLELRSGAQQLASPDTVVTEVAAVVAVVVEVLALDELAILIPCLLGVDHVIEVGEIDHTEQPSSWESRDHPLFRGPRRDTRSRQDGR
jgi:hypothetical protein